MALVKATDHTVTINVQLTGRVFGVPEDAADNNDIEETLRRALELQLESRAPIAGFAPFLDFDEQHAAIAVFEVLQHKVEDHGSLVEYDENSQSVNDVIDGLADGENIQVLSMDELMQQFQEFEQ